MQKFSLGRGREASRDGTNGKEWGIKGGYEERAKRLKIGKEFDRSATIILTWVQAE
jgi:hypothetical protein